MIPNARIILPAVVQFVALADDVSAPITARPTIDTAFATVDRLGNLPEHSTVIDATLDAIRRDKDPATDPAVRAALTARDLAPILTGAAEAVALDLVGNLDADDLIAALQPAHADAAADYTAAWHTLAPTGATGLRDPLLAAAAPPIADAAYAALLALRRLERLEQVTGALIVALGHSLAGATSVLHRVTDTNDSTLSDVRRTLGLGHNSLDPWQRLAAGYTISLATPTETDQRIEHAIAAEDEADRAAYAARRGHTFH